MYNFKPFTRGEPIDVTELARMNSHINAMNKRLLANNSARSSVEPGRDGPRKSIETPDLAIWTGKIMIAANVRPNEKAERVLWGATFTGTSFRTVPIVTATVYCDTTDGGTIAPSAVWIHSITPTGCRGRFKWLGNTGKNETVYALVIAIGQGDIRNV